MKLVGVFSREDESCYQWLTSHLVEGRKAMDVRPVAITNNFQQFMQEASKCDFAILYHSKKRGRINVTDVTDSLYDKELKHLNKVFGKRNVLVVIDDLESSSEEEKNRILQHQPSIANLARGLLLFSSADKDGYQASAQFLAKLDEIRRMIRGDKERNAQDPERAPALRPPAQQQRRKPTCRCIVLFIAVVIVIVFLVVIVVLAINNSMHAAPVTPPAPQTSPHALQTSPHAPWTTPPGNSTVTPSPTISTMNSRGWHSNSTAGG